MVPNLPVGLVTFYFSDIEGSTRLVQSLSDEAWAKVIDRHYAITESHLEGSTGTKVRTIGDAFFVVFTDPIDAVGTALDIQRAHVEAPWPEGCELRVRIGLHTGMAALGGDDYVGIDVHLAARVSAAAHGGQTLISDETARQVAGYLPADVRVLDLGSHRLKDITEPHRLYQVVAPGLDDVFPALKTEGRGELRMPADPTAFVGREREIGEIISILADSRLVTLTGPGGSGKTRLSKRVAESVVDDFPDGVYFVDLSALEDHELVMDAVLTAIGVHQTAGVTSLELAVTALRRARACLILDNLEQVIEAGPDIGALLTNAASLKVICTSRSPLRIRWEREYPVPPLAVPDASSGDDLANVEAVRLFMVRAREIDPDFDLAEHAEAVAAIVRRLDGLPLAIELAAARTRVLSPGDLLDRLDSSLDMLRSRRPDLPQRQRTLRGAIQWSYDLLDSESRRALADFSVFAGGCRLQELVAVCDAGHFEFVEDLLEVLLEQSLVRRDAQRFRMLQTIREFALERLAETGDEDGVRDRHVLTYRHLAESVSPKLQTRDRPAALNLLAPEHENFRAALDHAVESGDVDSALVLGAALWRYWQMRGYLVEARHRLESMTELPGGDPALRAAALEALGGVAYWQGDFDTAGRAYQDSLDMVREHGTEADVANALYNLAFAYGFSDDRETGRRLFGDAQEIYRRLGHDEGLGRVAWGLGNMDHLDGHPDKATESYSLAAEKLAGSEDEYTYGWTVDRLGVALSALGRIEEARSRLTEALDLFTASDDISARTMIFNDFADNAIRGGDFERALRIDGIVTALRARSGADLVVTDVNVVEGIPAAENVVGRDRAEELRSEGKAMSSSEATAYVRGEA